jgi:hypothetical protein
MERKLLPAVAEMNMMMNSQTDRIPAGCHFRSDCKAGSGRRFFDELLSDDWSVLTIKLDKSTGQYKWQTDCCIIERESK